MSLQDNRLRGLSLPFQGDRTAWDGRQHRQTLDWRWPCRVHGSAAAQIKEAGAQAAADTGPDLLETWLILEYCDQGSFDHAIRSGKFTKDLVQPSKLPSL